MPLDLRVGDVIETKKNHPCGSFKFELLRVGMDFRIRCLGCGKQIWIDRPDIEKRVKKVERDGEVFSKEALKNNLKSDTI